MLPLPNIEEINQVLSELPRIVQAYEARDAMFSELVKSWLGRAEAVLHSNRLPVTGAIAALRASVVSAERGAVPAGLTFVSPSTPRKCRDAAAAEALRRAEEQIANTIRTDLAQVGEAERVLRQMVSLARFKGFLGRGSGMPVQSIWQRFQSEAELVQGTLRVEGLVGHNNAVALLDRMI